MQRNISPSKIPLMLILLVTLSRERKIQGADMIRQSIDKAEITLMLHDCQGRYTYHYFQ